MARGAELPTGTLTFLFTDIEGSTRLLHELGESYDAALTEHRRLLRASFEAFNGRELNTEGDAFFVAFERASDAVAAAVQFQLDLTAHEWPHEPIKVRAGLHTGDARIVDDDLVGMAIHEAARIASAAHGGQVLVSATTAALAGEVASFADVGRYHLKDIVGETQLLEVSHPSLPTFGRARLAVVRPNNLPTPATTLVAREAEVSELLELVASSPVVTIAGFGGAGKTRLAIALGRALLDERGGGVWFVDLAAAVDETTVREAIARDLDEILPSSVVILDNCEQVVDAVGIVVTQLRVESPSLAVICTSREPLEIPGEVVWRIPALDDAAATELFVDRARRANAGFELDAVGAASIARICQRLDGLPLAIELAAVRIRMLTPIEIEERLEDRLKLLTGGDRSNARQQTLRSAIDWSYDHLDDDEKLLFRRLGVFAGSFSMNALRGVCDFDDALKRDATDVAGALVDRSLLNVEYVGNRTRYRLLESLREYARDELHASGEADALSTEHLRWFAAWAERVEENHAEDLADSVHRNIENIGIALAWAATTDREAGLRLAVALAPYWRQRAFGEGYDAIASLLDAAPESTELRLRAVLALGGLAAARGASAEGLAYAEEAVAIDAGSPRWRGEAAYQLASNLAAADIERAAELFARADGLFDEAGLLSGRALAKHYLGIIEVNTGSTSAGYAHLLEAADFAERGTDVLVRCQVLGSLAQIEMLMGQVEAAYETIVRVMDIAERVNNLESLVLANTIAAQLDAYNGYLRSAADHNRQIIELFDVAAVGVDMRCQVRCELASTLVALGEFEEAREVLTVELATLRPDASLGRARMLSCLGLTELHAGRFDEALRVLGEARDVMNDAGLHELVDDPSVDLAATYIALGRVGDGRAVINPASRGMTAIALLVAEDRSSDALDLLNEWIATNAPTARLVMAAPLEIAGHVLARTDKGEVAAEILGATLAAYESLELAEGAPARLRRERSTELLVNRIGQAAFDAAAKRGAAMPVEEAFAYARDELRTTGN